MAKYKKDFDDQAYKLCLLGAIDEDLADFFGVSVQSINVWKRKYAGFKDALDRGKNIANAEVAEALFNRARGYEHPETKVFNNNGEIITHEITKHYPPDTQAASLWLRNRTVHQSSIGPQWKDRQEIDATLSYEDMSDEQIEARILQLEKKLESGG